MGELTIFCSSRCCHSCRTRTQRSVGTSAHRAKGSGICWRILRSLQTSDSTGEEAMSKRMKDWALIVLNAALVAGPALAADDPAVLKDLTTVIALQGQPCGQGVTAARQGDTDYSATSPYGSRYRGFVNSQDRPCRWRQ